jgi:TPR repeat protein
MEYSAEQGLPSAQYDFGTLHATGTGTTANVFEAARWIGRAAIAGHVEAELEYGIMLFKGQGLTPDEVRGAWYFRSAAEKGNAIAQNRYARCLAHGAGVQMNVVEATKWHLIAKSAGVEDKALDEIAAKLSRADRLAAEKAAFSWRDQAMLN